MYKQEISPFAKQMQERLKKTWENLSKIRYKVAVMGGKGGVGKTTVAVNIAALLAETHKVGLLDADIDCPNVNRFLGITERFLVKGEKTILPVEKDGLKVVSMASLQEAEDTAIMWRGPLIANTLAQFLENTEWGDIEYLFFDAPPGTSDVSLSLMQNVDISGIIIVSTPQSVSIVDARKTINMANQLKVKILGLVENMSGEIFGSGSVEALAKKVGVPFLGRIELDKKMAQLAEKGLVQSKNDQTFRKDFQAIAERLQESLHA